MNADATRCRTVPISATAVSDHPHFDRKPNLSPYLPELCFSAHLDGIHAWSLAAAWRCPVPTRTESRSRLLQTVSVCPASRNLPVRRAETAPLHWAPSRRWPAHPHGSPTCFHSAPALRAQGSHLPLCAQPRFSTHAAWVSYSASCVPSRTLPTRTGPDVRAMIHFGRDRRR
ncbi:hypothetical protein GY45DRAFT_314596 [Cubamyces sp. BRFM 1775]|nr:hypothetical protein GY45DRAFT_314596 [Cubamyces sp. BRFM 1775]